MQLQSFIRSQNPNFNQAPAITILEKILTNKRNRKGLMSDLYNMLITASLEFSISKRKAWESDLLVRITTDEWKKAFKRAQTQTSNMRLKLLQLNWLMRLSVTPVKLNKINMNILDVYNRCRDERGVLYFIVYGYARKSRSSG